MIGNILAKFEKSIEWIFFREMTLKLNQNEDLTTICTCTHIIPVQLCFIKQLHVSMSCVCELHTSLDDQQHHYKTNKTSDHGQRGMSARGIGGLFL